MFKFKECLFIGLLLSVFFISCSHAPKSFIKIYKPTWASVELRDNLSFDEAWHRVVDVLAKKFELEMISIDGGYIRTSWIYSWWKEGKLTEDYRVRAIVKFSPDQKQLDIKTEANYLKKGSWVMGTDTRLLSTIKTDIMGVVGRTTR